VLVQLVDHDIYQALFRWLTPVAVSSLFCSCILLSSSKFWNSIPGPTYTYLACKISKTTDPRITMSQGLAKAQALVEGLTRYHFKDNSLVLEALNQAGTAEFPDNRRLACVGKLDLHELIVEEWYPTMGDLEEMNNLRISIGHKKNLALIGRRNGLADHISIHAGQHGRVPSDAVVADAVEAVLGAIHRDSHWDANALRAAALGLGIDLRAPIH